MAQQQFASIAVLIALTFMVLALASCANTEQAPANHGPTVIAPLPSADESTPEFHGARIGQDTLRSRLPTE